MRANELQILSSAGAVSAFADPERRRLLEALGTAPDSSAGLARRLGETRQRLNYHLRVLEDAGVVELQEERQRRGFIERVFRLAARRYVVDPAALGTLGAGDVVNPGDRFSATLLVSLAARAIREVASLIEHAKSQRKRVATASLDGVVRLARPADFAMFADDLGRAVARVIAEHDGGDAAASRSFRVVVAVHPELHANTSSVSEHT
jgi:DNA-binding transcriptional ArsR family regulator